MPRIVTKGPLRYALRSWLALMRISVATALRRARRGPLVEGWPLDIEIGTLFWRGQFTRAMTMNDIAEGRRYFDSLQTYTDERFEIRRSASGAPRGTWIEPKAGRSGATLLYLHGGGYSFHGAVSHRFAETLAAILETRLFALDYRLTPEHAHPAQREDALAAYRHLLAQGHAPQKLVLIGDSAGGHLVLMLLVALREAGLPQPALAVGLCPWTDIGARGLSFHANDRSDVVQGWMALRFGEWLVGDTGARREDLSPIRQRYAGLAPLYLQAGASEVLVDMIRDFALVTAAQGAEVTLDVWPGMTHNFHFHGRTRPESREALDRVAAAIAHYTGAPSPGTAFAMLPGRTEIAQPRPR